MRLDFQHVADSSQERHSTFSSKWGGQRGSPGGDPLAGCLFQSMGVNNSITCRRDRQFVATHFTFNPHLARDPPDCRMVEQQSLDRPLDEVHPQVPAANVG